MKSYQVIIFAPDNEKLIYEIIDTACKAGAGIVGKYSHNASIVKAAGQWKSEKGSHPSIGKVGELTRIKEVRIELPCPRNKMREVSAAIRRVHPYEEPDILFIPVEVIP